MPEKLNLEQFRNQPEHEIKKDTKEMEEIELSEEDIEILPDEFGHETAEKMETEAETMVKKGEEEIVHIDEQSGLEGEQLSEAKKEIGADEEMKSFGQKVGEALGRAKEKIYGLFGKKEESEKKPAVVFEGAFDPEEELKQISQLPRAHGERGQALDEFKEKLAAQKEGLAKIQVQLFEYLRANPDISLEELNQKVVELGSKIGMSESQRELANEVLEMYIEKHQEIKKIKEKYPDDAELFKALFGQLPKGKIQVVEGPMTLGFRLLDEKDYRQVIETAVELSPQKNMPQENKGRLIESLVKNSMGQSVPETLLPEMDDVVIIEKADSEKFTEKTTKIFDHEEQHAFKKLFEEQKMSVNAIEEFRNSQTDEERESALKHFCLYNRQKIEFKAKDEILAYSKDVQHTPELIAATLLKSKKEGGIYDWFADGHLEQSLVGHMKSKIGEEYVPMLKKVIQEVFVDEYKNLIYESVKASDELKKSGLSTDETIALLTHEPLYKWKTVVKRMLEAKK